MRAMVFAAGVGSRLRPLTDDTPKALVEIAGTPMLEIVIRRLLKFGVDAIVVNVHHHPEKIESFLRSKRNFGIRIDVSREETERLETGGGLKKAASFFSGGAPFFAHNVDVLCDADLGGMLAAHSKKKALATLAVRDRPSSRRLLFDAGGRLAGREPGAGTPLGFDGIHVISPAIFSKMTEAGVFSITDVYLRLAAAGERIMAYRTDGSYWRDIGGMDKLEAARADIEAGRYR